MKYITLLIIIFYVIMYENKSLFSNLFSYVIVCIIIFTSILHEEYIINPSYQCLCIVILYILSGGIIMLEEMEQNYYPNLYIRVANIIILLYCWRLIYDICKDTKLDNEITEDDFKTVSV